MPALCLAIGVLVPTLTWAQPDPIGPWDGTQFANHCRAFLNAPFSPEGSQCRGYLLGFIAGADAVQQAMNLAPDDSAKASSFTDRALRTRVGPRLESRRPEPLPMFCVDARADLRRVVEGTLARLSSDPPDDGRSVSNALCRTLVQAFPCESD